MRNNASLFILTLFLLSGCGKKANEDEGVPEIITPGISSDRYLERINLHRRGLGLKDLEIAQVIEEQAFEHSRAMASKRREYGHYGKTHRCRKIKEEFGVGTRCEEIIAQGPKSAQELYRTWLNSNRDFIQSPKFTHSGIGHATDVDGVMYWTQIFYSVQ